MGSGFGGFGDAPQPPSFGGEILPVAPQPSMDLGLIPPPPPQGFPLPGPMMQGGMVPPPPPTMTAALGVVVPPPQMQQMAQPQPPGDPITTFVQGCKCDHSS